MTDLTYPMSSFITTVDLNFSDRSRINNFLYDMQTRLGDGYIPLYKKLDTIPINKIYRLNSVDENGASASYNPLTNVIVLKENA